MSQSSTLVKYEQWNDVATLPPTSRCAAKRIYWVGVGGMSTHLRVDLNLCTLLGFRETNT